MSFFVYLLECNDGTYYIGVTNNLNRRLREHQEGIVSGCFTFSRRPVRLKYYLVFDNIYEAIKVEKKLKKWSKAKKDAYFKKDWEDLHELSRCKNLTSFKNRKI
jgi:putative endonuclease